jgi:LacI family transcriptional regulator
VAAPEVVRTGVTAVLAYNDLVAIGLVEGLAQLGVDVPSAVSVVGIDDIMPARVNRPRLTTVSMPSIAAGRTAVDMLLQLVGSAETGGAAQTTLETALVVRESTTTVQPSPAQPPASRSSREAS